ncbi:hypothetical protein F200043G1_32090 [[Clostridium] innocuum]
MPDYGRKQNLQFFSWSIHAATGGVEKSAIADAELRGKWHVGYGNESSIQSL